MGIHHEIYSHFFCDGRCCTSPMEDASNHILGTSIEANIQTAKRHGWTEINGKWYAPGHAPEGGGE